MSIRLGLDRVRVLLRHIPYSRPTIHIAGTNGKGSTSTLIEHVLLAASLTVGKFTSPHLVHTHDCISINGRAVSPEIFASHHAHVNSLSDERRIGATSFEILTVTACSIFEQENVDVVIMEVGMGGRLDATNALPDRVMLISGIATLGLDHQAFLGNSIAEIAREKSGIIRDHGIVVLGDQESIWEDLIEGVVKQFAENGGARFERSQTAVLVTEATPPLFHDDGSFTPPTPQRISLPSISSPSDRIVASLHLLGTHQLSNAGLAHTILLRLIHTYLTLFGHIADSHIQQGFASAQWAGRLSWLTIPCPSPSSPLALLVDGAHNASSAEALSNYLLSFPPSPSTTSRTFILALSSSPPKTPLSTLERLLRRGDHVALVPFTEPVEDMPWVRNVPPEEMTDVVRDLIGEKGEIWKAGEDEGLREAFGWAREKGRWAVLAGSLYLVADLYRSLEGE